jgi:hypothetical protein
LVVYLDEGPGGMAERTKALVSKTNNPVFSNFLQLLKKFKIINNY